MPTRLCKKCDTRKAMEEFPRNKGKPAGRDWTCKACHCVYAKAWAAANKEKKAAYMKQWLSDNASHVKEYKHKNRQRYRDKKNLWYQELKVAHCCERCGEDHPACLEFHHRDRESKVGDVSAMVRDGYSYKQILAEIEKCIPLCANCHKKEHWHARAKSREAQSARLAAHT